MSLCNDTELTGNIKYNIWQFQRAIQTTLHVLTEHNIAFKQSIIWPNEKLRRPAV